MHTTFAIFVAVILFMWCGAGPAFLLLRERGAHRILAIPAVGICSCVLFTLCIAQFGFTGRTIGILALVFFGALNVAGWLRGRPSAAEWRSAVPVGVCCAAALAIAAWPLMRMGCENYWGFGNPDHALYVSILEYLDSHSFGVAPREYLGTFYSLGGNDLLSIGYDSSVILGISYFFSMLSLITGTPAGLLFGVMTAAVACVVPASVAVLCEFGLGLPRRTSVMAAALASCSSFTAYTLYLHSLGTMTVIALLPVAVAAALDYFRKPATPGLVLAVLMAVGLYYDYWAGFAVLGLATAALGAAFLLRRQVSIRSLGTFAFCVAAGLLAIATTHGVTIFNRLLFESFSGRLASKEELLATFALVLTERGVPFFWGLRLPHTGGHLLFGSEAVSFWAYFTLGAVFFLGLGLAAWRKLSSIGAEYACAVGSIFALLVVYAITGNGYGAFKVVAWAHPLMLIALVTSMLGLRRWLQTHRLRALSVLPLAALGAYGALNLANAYELGMDSLGRRTGGTNNAPRLRLQDMRQLQQVADKWGRDGIVVGLPDTIAQYWLIPFFRHSVAQFFPRVNLNVQDSSPRSTREPPLGKYVLHWTDDSLELAGATLDRAVWRNEKFALSPIGSCRDFMVFGLGWYRKETVGGSSLDWQRRFRWLRKRGELLILNPSARPNRVLVEMIAGLGNSSPERHVDFILNGAKFDEIDFVAQTRVLTKPFTASGSWAQIELLVHESASPLPRKHALWNDWVPSDARHLNVALAEATLIAADQADSILESSAEFGPGHRAEALTNGIYADGWATETVSVVLRVPPRAAEVEIAGTIPGVRTFSFPYRMPLSVNGVVVKDVVVSTPGAFRVRIPLAPSGLNLAPGTSARLVIGPLPTFSGKGLGVNDDTRRLAIMLSRVALAGSPPEVTTQDRRQARPRS